MKRGFWLILVMLLSCCSASAIAAPATISTFWPFYDYRASEPADYRSLHLFGPLVKYESKGFETETALRPLFYRAADAEGNSSIDVLYPLLGYRRDQETTRFHLLKLLNVDSGPGSNERNRSYLFPFLFYGEEEQGRYAAFFPFGGKLYNWFGRDRITFALFPLYGHTERNGTHIDNVLWPFFARISGEQETGFKLWPLYGQSRKTGVYHKRFFLWPIFFAEEDRLDSDNPEKLRAVWPFYMRKESAKVISRTVLWPFFSTVEHHDKQYREWNAPWPLIKVMRGDAYHGLRLLPFYADETMDVSRKRWYLWPLYKIDEMDTEQIARRRDQLLYFLYSDTLEIAKDSGDTRRRIDLWPLFGYQQERGVRHLHVLSLLEPFFRENEAIERLWAPLWRIYQQKWDRQGNHVVSLLWNLFWRERQGDQLAWELFPLAAYRRESPETMDFEFLKGLVHYRRNATQRQLNVLYLPWGLSWDDAVAEAE
ncbi:MAG: hypothetical protein P8Y91_02240 [Desulfuromonadales bacterium]